MENLFRMSQTTLDAGLESQPVPEMVKESKYRVQSVSSEYSTSSITQTKRGQDHINQDYIIYITQKLKEDYPFPTKNTKEKKFVGKVKVPGPQNIQKKHVSC